jgi:cytochrome b561
LILIVARVIWRLKNGLPPPVKPMVAWEHRLAKLAHWLLLAGTLAMPLTGMMHSGAGGHGISVFGWTLVPGQHNPNNSSEAIPYNAAVAEFGEEAHELLGYAITALLILHLVAAMKHHRIDKDSTLLRMLGQANDKT